MLPLKEDIATEMGLSNSLVRQQFGLIYDYSHSEYKKKVMGRIAGSGKFFPVYFP